MSSDIATHPIGRILRDEGRRPSWLAERAGVSRQYVYLVLHGYKPASEKFRRACADALGRPVDQLFHDDTDKAAA